MFSCLFIFNFILFPISLSFLQHKISLLFPLIPWLVHLLSTFQLLPVPSLLDVALSKMSLTEDDWKEIECAWLKTERDRKYSGSFQRI